MIASGRFGRSRHEEAQATAEEVASAAEEVMEEETADVEALIAFSYPTETILMTQQMQEIGFSPDLFYATIGVTLQGNSDELLQHELIKKAYLGL